MPPQGFGLHHGVESRTRSRGDGVRDRVGPLFDAAMDRHHPNAGPVAMELFHAGSRYQIVKHVYRVGAR